jgi:hypothetical protein
MSDHIDAAACGMTVRVFRFEQKLRRLPLNPASEQLRRERDEVSAELIRLARLDRCLASVNLMAGTLE